MTNLYKPIVGRGTGRRNNALLVRFGRMTCPADQWRLPAANVCAVCGLFYAI